MPENTQTANQQYPKFIQNKPCGMDKFAGGSQGRLAQSIADHFVRNDDSSTTVESLPRIIGIEGGWGSGKSNVVKQLQKIEGIKDKYHFFEYDAWGHQEDLQRRSLLEILTEDLIKNHIITGKVDLVIKGGATIKVSWSEKLKYLLARKTETTTEKYPQITYSALAAVLTLIFTPVFVLIAFYLDCEIFGKLLVSIVPFICSLIAWGIAAWRNENYRNPSYLLAIYQDKIEKDVTYETISEDEPSVREFKSWMNDISKSLSDRKLVIVFDNMDRLPAEKVKELWSSIHTFFAEDGFDNVWAIIPFDEKHLTCAFGDCNDDNAKLLAKYFISKTFPIVYRVSDPVITDYRAIISTLYLEAFGNMYEEEANMINRIYRLLHPTPNMREIISFINELVAIHQQWGGNDISIVHMAIYIMKREDIKKDPVKNILSGEYLGDIRKIVRYTYDVQGQIAALTYGVEIDHARQIPIKNYILNCIKQTKGFDINKYSENKNFSTVLEEEVMQTDDSLIDNVISYLDKLNSSNVARLDIIWNYIGQRRQPKSIETQEFSYIDKILLSRIRLASKQPLINKIVTEICKCSKFDGVNYWRAMSSLDEFVTDVCPECSLNLQEIVTSPETFISYAQVAMMNGSIETYKLITDNDSLDNYLASQLPNNLISSEIISALKKAGYKFDVLLNQIQAAISDKKVDFDNFNSIFSVSKVLSGDDYVSMILTSVEVKRIYDEYVKNNQASKVISDGYYDISAMALMTGVNIADVSPETTKGVAEVLPHYLNDCSEFISNVVGSWNYPLHKHVIQYIIQNKISITVNAVALLPISEQIKTSAKITYADLFDYFNDNNYAELSEITQTNIKTVIASANLYQHTISNINSLTDHINKVAVSALSNTPEAELFANKANTASYYWFVAMGNLIETTYVQNLPDNVIEFGKHVLDEVAKGRMNVTLDPIITKIVGCISDAEKKSKVKEILANFIIGNPAITQDRFVFFEAMFRTLGDMHSEMTGRCVNNIIKPVFNITNCQKLILNNSEYYINLVNKGGDESTEFKKLIRTMITPSKTSLTTFAKAIGVELEESKE